MTSALLGCALLIMSARSACDAQYQDDKAVCQCTAAQSTDVALSRDTLNLCVGAARQVRDSCKRDATKDKICN